MNLFQVMVAAFCVSGYSSTYTRAGQKPFNPVLGETYECIREDKGWKFIAEQVTVVSAQPPPFQISPTGCAKKSKPQMLYTLLRQMLADFQKSLTVTISRKFAMQQWWDI